MKFSSVATSDVVLKTGLGLKTDLMTIFEVLVLAMVGLKDLKNCGLKTKKVLRLYLDLKDLKILILDKAKFQIDPYFR